MARVILENIENTGELARALSELPCDTPLSPFGSSNCKLVYDDNKKVAYIDEDFSFAEEEGIFIVNF